ncbi:hypothetical protein [Sinanaerobacter chloroacetimidivorans]|uniref:Methyl-accepting chemotaxis protein n=1 Tax=Sinanaerobacter chloroacetimidivorans TaxID=2818044 RepID=A0A8J8B0F9_9FIRM|nr:hypothetical protein [Sinanaerobacter chloroacetimidivorans]MBR0597563.1 hypothetical protein [Sinanaerobacter chloroacetimidivorans]
MQTGEAINTERKTNYDGLKTKIRNIKEGSYVIKAIMEEYMDSINQVFEKIKSVQGIANKTNLLAINASIETIHASDLLASFEKIVANNLLIQARILAQILEYDPDFLFQDGVKFARETGIEEFYITDDQGIVKFTNMPAWNNAKLNSAEVLKILHDPQLEIELPATGNGLDSTHFKVVAIARRDQPGVIQIGAHFIKPKGQLAIDGFGVVAQEAKRLADVSKVMSARITGLTNELFTEITNLKQSYDEAEKIIESNLEIAESAKQNESSMSQEEALQSMKVCLINLDNGLREIRKYFRGILSPLTELINIARQTNLLGVRAAIEAAHSTNDKQDFDNLLNVHMAVEAKLAATYIERRPDMTCEEMVPFADYIGVGEIWITDANGKVELTNVAGGKGYVFMNEGQTAPFYRLLASPELVVAMPPALRALDNRIFKYVGVGRKGKPGIFQVGNVSKMYGDSTAEGFAVVSKQIKDLAEQSREIATEIETMVESMEYKAVKAIETMKTVNKHRLETEMYWSELK